VTYLVDANVLSEPTKPTPSIRVVDWLIQNEIFITVDPIILGEIRSGVYLLPKGKKRERLEDWFDSGIAKLYCHSWDARCGLRWARLIADLRLAGLEMSVKDSMIAASALVHDLVLVTRNTKDFQMSGVSTLDPFADTSPRLE
jgi:predicted nucleic acid-binding protein